MRSKARLQDEIGPERTCIATGGKGAPEVMLRFVLDGTGQVAPDIRRKLPGRGVWTSLDAKAVEIALRRQAFSRGFRTKAEAAPDLVARIDALLESDALQFLSIVNKAGLLTTGAAKIDSALRAGAVRLLIHASNAAIDGSAKLDRLWRAAAPEGAAALAPVRIFASSQLDLALGRTNVIHAALGPGEASEAFLEKLRRLTKYRGQYSPAPVALTEGVGLNTSADSDDDKMSVGKSHE